MNRWLSLPVLTLILLATACESKTPSTSTASDTPEPSTPEGARTELAPPSPAYDGGAATPTDTLALPHVPAPIVQSGSEDLVP